MAFEVRKGRSCEILKDTLESRVFSLEDLNSAKDNRITGLVSQIKDYRSLDSASTLRYDNAQALYYIEKEKLKADKKKLWRVIFGEAAVITVLVISLL